MKCHDVLTPLRRQRSSIFQEAFAPDQRLTAFATSVSRERADAIIGPPPRHFTVSEASRKHHPRTMQAVIRAQFPRRRKPTVMLHSPDVRSRLAMFRGGEETARRRGAGLCER